MAKKSKELSFSAFQSFEEALRLPDGEEGFIVSGGAGRQHPMHRHRELEFNLVTRGSARYLLGDRRYEMRPRSLVWLFPAQDHILLEKSPDYRHWILVIRPEAVLRLCGGPGSRMLTEADPFGYLCRRLNESDAAHLETLLGEVAELSRKERDRFNAGLGYALLTAWSFFHRAGDEASGADIHPSVEAAVQLLRQREGDLLSIAQVAERCGMSESHLTRRFHAEIGMTPVAFRNRERIQRFLNLYGRGQRLSLLDAALTVGFGSYAQFHRVFKAVTGMSPAAYRRQRRE